MFLITGFNSFAVFDHKILKKNGIMDNLIFI